MKRQSVIAAMTVLVTVLSVQLSYADKGVFNAQATPHEVVVGGSSTVKVTAEIGSGSTYVIVSSIQVYQTTADGQPIALVSRMYDDGTHGDVTAADTVFSVDTSVGATSPTNLYFRVSAAYQGDRNRYMSPVVPVTVYAPIPTAVIDAAIQEVNALETSFAVLLAGGMNADAARQQVLADARANPNVTSAELSGEDLSILYANQVRGICFLTDPSAPTDGTGSSAAALPATYKSPGNAKLLIYAPGYSTGQNAIADHAQSQFTTAAWMTFDPHPAAITADAAAGLNVVNQWGTFGTVIMHTHGGLWTSGASQYVVLVTGTEATLLNEIYYMLDLITGRLGVAGDGRFVIYPSYVTAHCVPMQNTFFYLGACESLKNDTMWNALQAKGAKVGFGWSETVFRDFNAATFASLIDPMLPTDLNTTPLTAIQAFNGIGNKCDAHATPACLQMRVSSADWQNFLFYQGGLINGDFETGDWTGWTHGGDYDVYTEVVSSRRHNGQYAAAIGRWDAAYTGYNPTLEPYGISYFYQDFVVPNNVTYLKFDWWQEGYDTAIWDWFDAYIMNTNGSVLRTLTAEAGKAGSNYGPYWNTSTLVPVVDSGGTVGIGVGGGWYEVTADISAYRGQKIRIYFDERLDGYGDQTRTYIDDVRLE